MWLAAWLERVLPECDMALLEQHIRICEACLTLGHQLALEVELENLR